jgi:hypothetical protein
MTMTNKKILVERKRKNIIKEEIKDAKKII